MKETFSKETSGQEANQTLNVSILCMRALILVGQQVADDQWLAFSVPCQFVIRTVDKPDFDNDFFFGTPRGCQKIKNKCPDKYMCACEKHFGKQTRL